MEAQTAKELADNERDERAQITSVERAAKVVERDRKRRDRKRAEKVAADEAQRVTAAERDRKCAEKWTAEVDESIKSMLNGGVSFSKIASKLGKGLTENDIKNRWHTKLKKSSGIIKPAVQSGYPSRITWTEEVDATIVRMRTDGESFPKIASELGNGLTKHDITNRWNRHLKTN